MKYQDEVHGSLIEQIDKMADLVYTKYLKALIYYEGIQRIEQFMFPQEAFREILLNAVVHKDYSACNPIQISIYEDKIYIWNDSEMPSELDSTEKLFEKHFFRSYNPKLENVFFKSGMIEAWAEDLIKSRRHYLNPMIKTGQLKLTIPENPKSGNQKYINRNMGKS